MALAELSEITIGLAGALTAVVVAFGAFYKTKVKDKQGTYAVLLAQLEKLSLRQEKLEQEIQGLRKQLDELKDFRSKFQISLGYIRDLCHWVGTLPGIDVKGKPNMPAVIKEHYGKYEIKREE